MKVLFLDIDGVVNCATTTQRHGGFIGISPSMAARVRQNIKETGCKVVLSSTWRLNEPSREHVRNNVCDFIDVTPDNQFGYKYGLTPRGGEINDWLDKHPKVTRYAILDDGSDFYDEQPLFKTTWLHGLTEEIAQQVTDYLNETTD